MKSKIFDCITFFDNNFMFDLRYNILKNFVDYFIICESIFDHRGNQKKKNFIKKEYYDYKKIKYFLLEKPFPKNTSIWENQAIQREFLLKNVKELADEDDYIFFSDPDEIPRPEILTNFSLKKNTVFLCKNVLIINLTFLISLKVLGRVQEFPKKKTSNQLIL